VQQAVFAFAKYANITPLARYTEVKVKLMQGDLRLFMVVYFLSCPGVRARAFLRAVS